MDFRIALCANDFAWRVTERTSLLRCLSVADICGVSQELASSGAGMLLKDLKADLICMGELDWIRVIVKSVTGLGRCCARRFRFIKSYS